VTTFTDEVRDTVSPHKFGGSRRAAAAWLISHDADEQTGDAQDYGAWSARIGRTILTCDSQGFVDAARYDTEDLARREFERLDREYQTWCNGGEWLELPAFDLGPAYRAEGHDGIAWRVDGWETEPVPSTEWTGEEKPTGRLRAHMIGDDRTFTFDPDELTPIGEDDYCADCGQIGCDWH
jgi:hypothetical protein